jgi:hypothetical protein
VPRIGIEPRSMYLRLSSSNLDRIFTKFQISKLLPAAKVLRRQIFKFSLE